MSAATSRSSPAASQEAAFFMIQGQELRWGIATAHITRIAAEDEANPPPPLLLPTAFLPFDDGLVGRWMLIIGTPLGERSLLVSRFVELVPTEQLNLQPLPPLCRPAATAEAQASAEITHVAIAATSDYPLFLVLSPTQPTSPAAPARVAPDPLAG